MIPYLLKSDSVYKQVAGLIIKKESYHFLFLICLTWFQSEILRNKS